MNKINIKNPLTIFTTSLKTEGVNLIVEAEEVEVIEEENLITFTHKHYSSGVTTYQAIEGMTWEEFINSDYNTNNVFTVFPGGGVFFNNNSNSVQDASGNFMVKTDIITSQEYYTTIYEPGGSN